MANSDKNLDLSARDELVERLRELIGAGSAVVEKNMMGGVCFMVDNRMLVAAFKDGSLLVRADADCNEDLLRESGAEQAMMGPGRSMGPNWISVAGEAIAEDARLTFWVEVARDFHRKSA